jgi:hypothetical protein
MSQHIHASAAPLLPACTQCAAPIDCSLVRDGKHAGNCGLHTLSATHLGAAIAILVTIIPFAVEASHQLFSPTSNTDPFDLFFWTAYGVAAIYYIFAEWRTEDLDYLKYRDVDWSENTKQRVPYLASKIRLKWAEFGLRVLLTFIFGMVFFVPSLAPSNWSKVDAQTAFLAFIYFLFIAWDFLIVVGGGLPLKARIVALDVLGFACVLLALWLHSMRWGEWKLFNTDFINRELAAWSICMTSIVTLITLAFMIKREDFSWTDRRSFR